MTRIISPSDPSQRIREILDRIQEGEGARILRDYLDERINLGKAAELLQLSRFELEESFQNLGIPIRRGACSVEDAEAEIAAARRHAVEEERLEIDVARLVEEERDRWPT
jgi:predicted HTH domain antitoxin